MGVDSFALGNLASPHRIEHDGVVYEISLVDQRAKAEWERRLLERAISVAEMLAPMRPAGWLAKKLDQLSDEFMAGKFALLSEESLTLLKTAGGVQLLLSIITGKDLTELSPILLHKPEEVEAKLFLALRESFPGLKVEFKPGSHSPNS